MAPPEPRVQDDAIAAVRRYNRFYTQRLGLLNERLLGSRWSLTEARLLYELAHRPAPAASELARDLMLDAGYLSRILRRFEAAGLIERRRDRNDARRSHLLLTANGRQSFAALERESRIQIARLLAPLPSPARDALVASMSTIHGLLDPSGEVAAERRAADVVLREPAPGDVGWVIERHGAIYASEFGYDATFEGLVAKIAGTFLESHDASCERCWIAEHAGARAGAVFLVKVDEDSAKLRLLIVEPAARGLGVGARLVRACTDFARDAGYKRITLWTQSHLAAARHLYVTEGYRRVAEEPHRSFGLDLVAETWELDLVAGYSPGRKSGVER
jgi:DNA-binding MarR family transcriptional regulator/GNAT superfamily N-acetyltransferase